MKVHQSKRRFITLIEIMIVMFLIALITGVIGYNYIATLDKGKAFKSKAAIEKLETILSLKKAENPDADIKSDWQEIVRKSPLVKDPNALLKDGWGNEFEVSEDNGNIKVTSKKLEAYEKENPSSF